MGEAIAQALVGFGFLTLFLITLFIVYVTETRK